MNAALPVISAAGAAILTRLLLGVHIHHLLIGILLVCIGGIPAVLLRSEGRLKSLAVVVYTVLVGRFASVGRDKS